MEHILNLEQVKKYYGGNSGNITKAVDGISMYVDKGEFVAIMGASGSGKTTLLNCNLPYENGYEVCRKIKQVMPVPIIFVTSRDTNADELKSIQVGGIDFITKPYDTLILLEKIKRALQLSNPNNFRELVKKDCTLDLHLSILKYQEQSIELTRNEFRILYYFFMNEDKVISKEELLEKLWNDKYYIDENVLLVNMTRLKKKMKEIGIVHLLENIRGKGWKL